MRGTVDTAIKEMDMVKDLLQTITLASTLAIRQGTTKEWQAA